MLEQEWGQDKYAECLINFLKRQGREVLEDTLMIIPIYTGTGEEDEFDCIEDKYTHHIFVKKIEGEQKHEWHLEECRGWITFMPKKELTEVILEEY